METILIDSDDDEQNENESEEILIDNSKIPLLKSNTTLIYYLFQTSLNIDKTSNLNTLNQKQVDLIGEINKRIKTKKFISAICNPEYTSSTQINQEMIKNLETNDLKNKLMRQHTTFLSISRENTSNIQLYIQGKKEDVLRFQSALEIKKKENNMEEHEEDIICLSDGPFEKFVSEKKKKSSNNHVFSTQIKPMVITLDDDIEDKLNKLEVNKETIKVPVALQKTATLLGFSKNEILHLYTKLDSKDISETDFMNKLREARKLSKDNEIEMNTVVTRSQNQYNKTDISPSIKNNGPASKKFLASGSCCEIIDVDTKKTHDQKKVSDSVLEEYGEMFQTQDFNSGTERLNKVKRISALIAAMPSAQKSEALNQINKIHANRPQANQEQIQFERTLIEKSSSGTSICDEDKKKSIDSNNIEMDETSNKQNVDPSRADSTKAMDFDFSSGFIPLSSHTSNRVRFAQEQQQTQKTVPYFKKSKNSKHRSRSNSSKNRNKSNTRASSSQNTNFAAELAKATTSKFTSDKILVNHSKPDELMQLNINNLESNSKNQTNTVSIPLNPSKESNLRYIVIDGSNVAREHGNQIGRVFSCKGIQLVVDYFVQRGHTNITALIPRFRRGTADKEIPTVQPEILDDLEKKNFLTYTPSRYVDNKLIIPYDDRFIMKTAAHYNAIIVSNDNYRDLMLENAEWKKMIQTNLLQYSFVGDLFLIADDPMGRRGPHLDELLSNKPIKNQNSFNKNLNTKNNQPQFNPKQQQYQQSGKQNRDNMSRGMNINNPTFSAFNQPQPKIGVNINRNKQLRTQEETDFLYKKLSEVFTTKNTPIRNLLREYPCEFEIEFFSHKLLE